MKIHILGICGTFMASVAVIAQSLGHEVSGSDDNIFPPMSTMLTEQGIAVFPTAECVVKVLKPDLVIIGNAKSRGDINVEYVLNASIPYCSGPAWLAEALLRHRWVITAAGTHGKTTTSSMVAWILERAGLNPGFLIGGVPRNFAVSGRVGQSPYFVIEGDEYDTAFFDKRSKLILYHTKTAIINNIEFDHADIFADIEAIKKQFHIFVKTVPGDGLIVHNGADHHVADVLARGCWSAKQSFAAPGSRWCAQLLAEDGSQFSVLDQGKKVAEVHWPLLGNHNVNNALAAIAAAHHTGVAVAKACEALCHFQSVKRRLEVRGVENNITVYDDFAHHPTEIKTTLRGLRNKIGSSRLIAIIEFVSSSMRRGIHQHGLVDAFADADLILCRQPEWNIAELFKNKGQIISVFENADAIVQHLKPQLQPGDHIVVMSNKGFENIYDKLLNAAKGFIVKK